MRISSKIEEIKKSLPENVKLVAVSKLHPTETIQEAYNTGHRIFGESRVQELELKKPQLPSDIEWHFIGHLQTNKVKNIVPYIHTIHSVDSWKLLKEIEKQATTVDRKINCLLEIHIAQEESKYGFSYDSCREFLEKTPWNELHYVQITGVMGIATNTDNETIIKNEFKMLKSFFDELKSNYFKEKGYFSEISMGMSQDYKLGVEEGSTMVRIGSLIFGNRT